MLCEVSQSQAKWIWSTLRNARLHESKVSEESITDFLILQLKKEAKGEYYVNSFTRPKEKVTGADWELWITGPSSKWLGLRVQAKVISLDSRKYAQLHYKRKDGTYQIDQLVADAKKHSAIPLYCLYSYWRSPEAGKLKWPLSTVKRNSRLFGASWMSVGSVQALKPLGLNSLKIVAKRLHPFHRLFCCDDQHLADLPSRVRAELNELGFLEPEAPELLDEPPYYVSQLLGARAEQADLVDVHDENLRRVVILRETERGRSNISVITDAMWEVAQRQLPSR